MRNILRDMVAAHRENHRVPDIAIDIDRQVRCAAANITNRDTHLTFLLGQDHFRRGEWIQNKLLNFNSRRANTLTKIIHSCGGGCDNVSFHFKFIAVHSNWSPHAFLSIDRDAALNDMYDLAVMRNGNRLRLFKCARNIHRINNSAGDTGRAAAVDRGYMRARQADQSGRDLHTRGALCFFH